MNGRRAPLTAGFVITGEAPRRVLVRAAGPALASFGFAAPLGDPMLAVIRDGWAVGENDDWQLSGDTEAEIASAATQAGAFPFPRGGKDAAVILTLNPGACSAVVSGVGEAAGTAFVEVYELP